MKYAFSKDRNLSFAAGIALDRALKEYRLREKDVIIEQNEFHKPYLKDYPEVHFNLSHSGKKAICAISDKEVGCDIEEIKDPVTEVISRCFSKEEQAYIEKSIDKREAFYRIWVAKESFLKAIGTGINDDMTRFSTIPKGDTILLMQNIDKKTWVITEKKTEGYIYAVCTEY